MFEMQCFLKRMRSNELTGMDSIEQPGACASGLYFGEDLGFSGFCVGKRSIQCMVKDDLEQPGVPGLRACLSEKTLDLRLLSALISKKFRRI